MTRVSLIEDYDDRSVISKLNIMSKQVDANTQTVESAVTQASEAAASAQRTADTFAGAVGSVVADAKADMAASKQAALEAASQVTDISDKVDQFADKADAASTKAQQALDITSSYETDIETAKDKADLAYTTASGFSDEIAAMQSTVASTQQEMVNVRTTAQNASQQATVTDGRLTLHIATAEQTYATKTEMADKASVGDLASVVLTVNGKLSESQADAKYQPKGDYLTEHQSLTHLATKQEVGVIDGRVAALEQKEDEDSKAIWGQITGTLADQTDLKQALDGKQMVGDYVTQNQMSAYATTSDLAGGLATKQDKGDYALKSEIPDVSGFATKTEVESGLATKQPVGDYVTKGEITGVYHYRGTKSTKSQLPEEDNIVGDVWNVASTGMNYAWTGTEWDALGMDVDLSDYVTNVNMQTYVAQEISPVTERVSDLEEFQGTATTVMQANTAGILTKADKSYADEINDGLTALSERVDTKADTTLLIGVSNHADLLDTTKQDKLIPGEGISIEDNVISATGGSGSAITSIATFMDTSDANVYYIKNKWNDGTEHREGAVPIYTSNYIAAPENHTLVSGRWVSQNTLNKQKAHYAEGYLVPNYLNNKWGKFATFKNNVGSWIAEGFMYTHDYSTTPNTIYKKKFVISAQMEVREGYFAIEGLETYGDYKGVEIGGNVWVFKVVMDNRESYGDRSNVTIWAKCVNKQNDLYLYAYITNGMGDIRSTNLFISSSFGNYEESYLVNTLMRGDNLKADPYLIPREGGGFPTWPADVNDAMVPESVRTGAESFAFIDTDSSSNPFIKMSQFTNHPSILATKPTLARRYVWVMYTQKECRAVIGDQDIVSLGLTVDEGDGIWSDIPADTFVYFTYSSSTIGSTDYARLGIHTSGGVNVTQTFSGISAVRLFLDDKVGN